MSALPPARPSRHPQAYRFVLLKALRPIPHWPPEFLPETVLPSAASARCNNLSEHTGKIPALKKRSGKSLLSRPADTSFRRGTSFPFSPYIVILVPVFCGQVRAQPAFSFPCQGVSPAASPAGTFSRHFPSAVFPPRTIRRRAIRTSRKYPEYRTLHGASWNC